MKSPITIVAAMLSAAALAALAADPPKDAPKKQLTPQQQRMSDCSKASKGLKKEEHDKFMKECLKKDSTIDVSQPAKMGDGKPTDAKAGSGKPTQQEKMTSCNKLADKDKLKGDARQKFMSDCLKGAA